MLYINKQEEKQNSKFILFAWNNCWPKGGQNDIFGVYSSSEKACKSFDSMIRKKGEGWYNILYKTKTERGKDLEIWDGVHEAHVYSVDEGKTVMTWKCDNLWESV